MLMLKLTISEAVFYATLATNEKIKNGVDKFNRWRQKIANKLLPEEQRTTVWDKLDRLRKKGKPTVKL